MAIDYKALIDDAEVIMDKRSERDKVSEDQLKQVITVLAQELGVDFRTVVIGVMELSRRGACAVSSPASLSAEVKCVYTKGVIKTITKGKVLETLEKVTGLKKFRVIGEALAEPMAKHSLQLIKVILKNDLSPQAL